MKRAFCLALSLCAMCGCSATKQTATTPQPQPVPIVETWTVTVANSSSSPSGLTPSPATLNTQSIPVDTCMTNFDTLVPAGSMTVPSSFTTCAYVTDIPLPTGQSNWIQTLIMGTGSMDLYSGEVVTYTLVDDSSDGSTSIVLGGNGTFNETSSEANGTTTFTYTISGPLNCLSINGTMTAACAAWNTTFSATF